MAKKKNKFTVNVEWNRIEGVDTYPPFDQDVHLISLGDTTQEKPVVVTHFGRMVSITKRGPNYKCNGRDLYVTPIAWSHVPVGPTNWMEAAWKKAQKKDEL